MNQLTTMESKLKPCPFCAQPVEMRWVHDPGQYEFYCNGCEALVIFHNDLTDGDAAEHWNIRVVT